MVHFNPTKSVHPVCGVLQRSVCNQSYILDALARVLAHPTLACEPIPIVPDMPVDRFIYECDRMGQKYLVLATLAKHETHLFAKPHAMAWSLLLIERLLGFDKHLSEHHDFDPSFLEALRPPYKASVTMNYLCQADGETLADFFTHGQSLMLFGKSLHT